jgi:hypothetical protein
LFDFSYEGLIDLSYGTKGGHGYGGHARHRGLRRHHVTVRETEHDYILDGGVIIPKAMPGAKGQVDAYVGTWDIDAHKKEELYEKRIERIAKSKQPDWKPKSFPASWKDDYGTVKYWKHANDNDYIHINKIRSTDRFRNSLYEEGYRYEIASNKFGTSHHKTLADAIKYAKLSMAS